MIKLVNISKKFDAGKGSTQALTDINLEIAEGEYLALMGPSGSGKTTLLNIIGGLDSPSDGQVIIKNKDISKYDDKQLSQFRNKEIGFIFQEFYLEPVLNVKENVKLPLYFSYDQKQKDSYIDKIIEEVELSQKSDSKVTDISGGQKQRTAIARALVNKPNIILADEPTGNLDLKTGQTIIELLEKLHKAHRVTLIIATHDEKIAASAKKIIKIKDGKIQ